MKSVMKMSLLFVGTCLVSLVGAARADASEVMKVQVPFPFLVHGQTFPAGQYRVRRDDSDPSVLLIQGKRGTHTNMYVLTNGAGGHDPAGDRPSLAFTKYENQYRLSDVWESGSEGRAILGK